MLFLARIKRDHIPYYCIVLFLAIFSPPVFGASTSDSCFPLPPRPAFLTEYVNNTLSWKTVLQGKTGYAGNVENPRPMPDATLSIFHNDLKKVWNRLNDTVCFAFSPQNIEHESSEIIRLPKQDLWCLTKPGDHVLLSDRKTHHYTMIGGIDHINNTISFIDFWPDIFFLKKGFNSAGVEATFQNGLFTITKNEYLRLIIGLITPDTPALIDHYIGYRSASKSDPKIMFSIGATYLEHVFFENVYRSIRYFRDTFALLDDNKSEFYYKVAQRLIFSLARASYLKFINEDIKAANQYARESDELAAKVGLKHIEPFFSVIDYYKLGNIAGTAGDLKSSIIYYTKAIKLDENFSKAYLYRAMAKMKQKDYAGAITDSSTALPLFDTEIAEIKTILKKPEKLGSFQMIERKEEIESIVHLKIETLVVRSKSYYHSGEMEKSFQDSQTVQHLQNEKTKDKRL